MPTQVTTLAGAVQFDGLTAATGRTVFTRWANVPRTTRVHIHQVAYHGAAGDAITRLDIWLVDPAGPATARMLIGRATAADLVGPTLETDYTICGREVPRGASGNWQLEVITVGKSQDASVTVDFSLLPWPDASPNDARS